MKMFLVIFQKVLVVGGLGMAIFVFLYVFIFDGNMDRMIEFKDKILRKKTKGTSNGKKDNKKNKNKKDKKSNQTSDNKKINKKSKDKVVVKDSRDILDFEKVIAFSPDNPIGLVVKKEKEYIGVVEVKGINYNLLSIEEREILEESFAKLLNGIDYPMQIYVQSRKVDIESYELKYTKRLEDIKKTLDRMNDKLIFLKESNEDIDKIVSMERDINRLATQYNYGLEIKEWIIARCKQKSMLERKYYLVVSHKHNTRSFKEELTEQEMVHNAFFDISNKSSSIVSALQRANLDGKLLTAFELTDLLYRAYNKSDSEYYKLDKALKSRFSHLYNTSKPVELKKLERQAKEIDEQLGKLNSKQKVGV